MDDRKHDRFCEAVANTVAEEGLRSVTVKNISSRVGCSEALLYKYFPSMDELMYAAYEYACNVLVSKFGEDLDRTLEESSDDPVKAFKAAWMHYVRSLLEIGNLAVYMVAFRDSQFGRSNRCSEIAQKVRFSVGASKTLQGIIDPIIKRNSENPDLEYRFIMDVVHSNVTRSIISGRKLTEEELEMIFNLTVHGISLDR